MILIIYSKLFKKEAHAITLFETEANKRGLEFSSIDIHSFIEKENRLTCLGNKVQINDCPIEKISSVICLNIPRCDATLRTGNVRYPNRLRYQIASFVEDLGYLLAEIPWVPGNFEAIARGNAKISLYYEAQKFGLETPAFTQYSLIKPSTDTWYQKSLGFPCLLSFDTENKTEELVQSLNGMVEETWQPDGYYYQWQTPIAAVSQIRCQIVAQRIWSAKWDKAKSPYLDMREVNSRQKKIAWQQYDLPKTETKKLFNLMSRMKLCAASPEFLLDERGNLIFYDLNPAGDFRGCFSEEINHEIVCSMLDLCI